MNKAISDLTKQISSASLDEVRANYKEYQELLSACQAQLFKATEAIKKESKILEQKRLDQLLKDTQYEECDYPEISYESGDAEEVSSGRDGSCVFTNKDQADDLIKRLVNQSYYYGHEFKWQGPGRYIITPSWKWDHDNEVIYTATYQLEAV